MLIKATDLLHVHAALTTALLLQEGKGGEEGGGQLPHLRALVRLLKLQRGWHGEEARRVRCHLLNVLNIAMHTSGHARRECVDCGLVGDILCQVRHPLLPIPPHPACCNHFTLRLIALHEV